MHLAAKPTVKEIQHPHSSREGLDAPPTFHSFDQPVNVERSSSLSNEVIMLENIQYV